MDPIQGKVAVLSFSNELILEVQIDHGDNKVRTSGQRTLDDRRMHWRRFQTEHHIPNGYDVRGIRVRFRDDTLYITFPKLVTEQPKPAAPTPPMPEKKQELGMKPKEEKEEKEEEEMGRQSQLVVNMIVAVTVLVIIGMYVSYKLEKYM
ncbi:hypothetical protein IEQ34_013785 [Dendrobium chrysotoxum]|uniref:SHSP domain-containing protein n=1 Tax=Dendrobium chrysotoxum TaxID=161865 RepID=A0AAV7GQD3_DENCH|nr:hypothetical protein IEQ34_013785 [Dendrobium chrysotoxum]